MTSKERCEALMEYIVEENQGYFDKKRIGNDLTAILIDLEELEKLKNLMGTPIQDIMKRLKVLEILKPYIELSSDGIISCHNLILIPYYKDYEEQYNLLKEWWLDENNTL